MYVNNVTQMQDAFHQKSDLSSCASITEEFQKMLSRAHSQVAVPYPYTKELCVHFIPLCIVTYCSSGVGTTGFWGLAPPFIYSGGTWGFVEL